MTDGRKHDAPEGVMSRQEELSDASERFVRDGGRPGEAKPREPEPRLAVQPLAADIGEPGLDTVGRLPGRDAAQPPPPPRARLRAALRVGAAVAVLAGLLLLFAPAAIDLARRAGSEGRSGAGVGDRDPEAPLEPLDLTLSMSVVSKPDGAEVWVNGVAQGRAPTLFNVDCAEGSDLRVRVEKRGYQPWERLVPCKQGRALEVKAVLDRE